MKKAIEDRLPIRTMKNSWNGQLFYFSHFDPNSGTTVRGTAPIPEFKGISYQEERELKEKWNKKYSWYRDKPFSPSPEVIDIKITDFCDFACNYCYQDSTTKGRHAPMKLIDAVIEGFDNRPYQVALGGGEPTSHPKFPKIVEKLYTNGIIPNYTTNGMFIHDDENRRHKIIDATNRWCGGVSLSYHAHMGKEYFKETYELLRRSFNSRYVQLNVQVIADVNVMEALEVMEEATFYGASLILLAYYPEVGRSNLDGLMDKKTYQELLPERIRYLVDRKDFKIAFSDGLVPYFLSRNVIPTGMTESSEGRFSCYIDDKGRMSHSSFDPPGENDPTIYDRRAQDLWNSLAYRNMYGAACDRCQFKRICDPPTPHSYFLCDFAEHNGNPIL